MCKVMIADDEYLEREVIKQIVNGIDGAQIIGEGNSGRKAIELCRALKPELVFINKEMGGINGVEAARQIRQDDKEIVIIMTTAYDDHVDTFDIKSLNISEYLLKPIKPKKIEEIVRKYSDRDSASNHQRVPAALKKDLQYYPKHIMSKEIVKALNFIDNNYRENICLDTVADEVFLSCYYFSRLFKKEVGVNFSSYLLHKRLDEAKFLLENSHKSILEISSYLNFKEQNYFCKVFKKSFAVTPTEYRKRAMKMKSERQSIAEKYL